MTEVETRSIFTLAGFTIHKMWELPDGYWPKHPNYDDVRQPWWLVRTEIGCIKIGRRKRVWSVDWSDTGVRGIVTGDQTTKNEDLVHAWTAPKLLEYLISLKQISKAKEKSCSSQ